MFGPELTRQEQFFRLERPFTRKEVRTRFRQASLKWHPDKNSHRLDRARELFIKLVETRNFLLALLNEYNGILYPPKKHPPKKDKRPLEKMVEEFLKKCARKKATSSSEFLGEEYGSKMVVLNALLKKNLNELHDTLGLFYKSSDRKRILIERLKKQTWETLNGAFRREHKSRIKSKLTF